MKKRFLENDIKKIRQLRNEEKTIQEIANIFHCATSSIYYHTSDESKRKQLESDKRYYKKHQKERIKYSKKYRKKFKHKIAIKDKKERQDKKYKVLYHYSNTKLICACCNESIYEFLTLDHPNNDGAKHRKQIGGSFAIYNWLIKNNYPKGFRVLCMNCNAARGWYGKCPHEKT